jgi:hypothetical protein
MPNPRPDPIDEPSRSGLFSVLFSRRLATAVVLPLLIGGLWFFGLARDDSIPSIEATGSVASSTRVEAPQSESVVSGGRVDSVLLPGRTLDVLAADLEREAPLSIQLGLPVRHEGDEPLRVRLMGEGRAPFATEARLSDDGDGQRASLEIPPDWLAPGATLIELEVRENSPLAVRRYVLRVR